MKTPKYPKKTIKPKKTQMGWVFFSEKPRFFNPDPGGGEKGVNAWLRLRKSNLLYYN